MNDVTMRTTIVLQGMAETPSCSLRPCWRPGRKVLGIGKAKMADRARSPMSRSPGDVFGAEDFPAQSETDPVSGLAIPARVCRWMPETPAVTDFVNTRWHCNQPPQHPLVLIIPLAGRRTLLVLAQRKTPRSGAIVLFLLPVANSREAWKAGEGNLPAFRELPDDDLSKAARQPERDPAREGLRHGDERVRAPNGEIIAVRENRDPGKASVRDHSTPRRLKNRVAILILLCREWNGLTDHRHLA